MRTTALVLDPTHRLVARIDVEAGPPGSNERPLATLQAAGRDRHGLELHIPLGRLRHDGELWFVFVESGTTGTTPLRTWAHDPALATGWRLYVDALLGGWEPPTRELDVCCFGNTPELATKLAHLVIKGRKHGSTGALATAQHLGEAIPSPGTRSVVTDHFGIPLCVIQTERVEHKRFGDAGEDIAIAEGEGDLSFEDWHAGHLRYFVAEAAEHGLTFDADSIVFHEFFRVERVLARQNV